MRHPIKLLRAMMRQMPTCQDGKMCRARLKQVGATIWDARAQRIRKLAVADGYQMIMDTHNMVGYVRANLLPMYNS